MIGGQPLDVGENGPVSARASGSPSRVPIKTPREPLATNAESPERKSPKCSTRNPHSLSHEDMNAFTSAKSFPAELSK